MCTITVTDVVGIGPDPSSIRVMGTVFDCAADPIEGDHVLVSVSCDENGEPFAKDQAADVDGINWLIIVDVPADAVCVCRKPVFVTARCATDDSCVSPPFTVSELRCPECPVVSIVAPEPGEELVSCNPDRSASVIIRALVDNPTPNDIRAFIECGANPQGQLETPTNFKEIPSGSVDFVEATCNYPTPSQPKPFVRFTDLNGVDLGCPEVEIAIVQIDECPCAEVEDLSVEVEGCTATFEGTFPAGFDICTFIWDFGDGTDDEETTEPKAEHEYACAGIYAVVVTAKCGEGCSETTTIVTTIVDCATCGACCFADGSCLELTEEECRTRGGQYKGDGSICNDVDCEPTVPPPDDDCWWCIWGCWIMLGLGVVLAITAAVLLVISGCNNFMPPSTWVTALVMGTLALGLLAFWGWICRFFLDCDTLCTMIDLVKLTIVLQAIAAAVFAILKLLGFVSGWGCTFGLIASLAYLGLVLVLLLQINQWAECGCEDTGK